MKHLKHISILFIAVLALLLLLTPKADAATVKSGTCGKNLTWTLDDAGTLTISGTGAMTDWEVEEGTPWYSSRSSIKKVVITSGVTTIGEFAFSRYTGLTSVTIGNSVTSIGNSAFSSCTGLTSVTIGNSVTSIGNSAFAYCDGLTSVTIGNSVTSIGYAAFSDCDGLTSVTIGNSVTSIGNSAFSYCTGLTSVTIGNGVTSIGRYTFYNCTKLTSVTIPDSVTTIGKDAFTNTAWYNNQPDGLVYAGKVAYKYKGTCPATVTIKDGTLGIAGSAFYDCTGLTSVTIPDSVTTIGNSAFDYCTDLTHVAYTGTQSQWSAISIGQDNGKLTGATRHYEISFQYKDNCVESGVYCPVCEQFIVSTVKAGGAHSFEAVVTAPTCTQAGSTTTTCTVCGETEIEKIAATGHSFKTVVIDPTCTQAGSTTKTCTACGEVQITAIAATGHSGTWIDLIQVSCSEDGLRARACTVCGTMETQSVPAFGHSYTAVVTAPTCSEQGYTTKTCSTCGNVEVTNYVSAKGHSWNSWITVKAATCAAEGTQMRFCNCGTTESQTIEKLPHSYENGSCTVCGAEQLNEKFDIDVARMILGNALEFQFGVATTKIPDKTGYYAIVEKTWADGTTTEKIVPAEEWGSAGAYHAVIYDGLAAKEMGDTFYVTIYNAKGQAVSNAKQDSVRDYVSRTYKTQSETGKTMMVDMLNYGAAAQVNFDYGTDDLANSKLTDAQKAVGTAEVATMGNYQIKGNFYLGTRFILKSRIQVQVAFAGLDNTHYAIYSYTNNAGELKEVRVESSEFITAGNINGIELGALVYADARTLVTVTVYNADGSVYGSAAESIESCAYRSNATVFVELMKFADSAKAHLYK